MHAEYPDITRLPLHLPSEQPVMFGRSDSEQELQQRMETAHSTLMGFFDYNRDHEDGRHLLYHQFPTHYVFLQKEKVWRPR